MAQVIHQKIQYCKDADHKGHIVIGEHGQRQRGTVEPEAPFSNDLLNAECNQGQKGHCVQPHNIPVIGDEKATEGIQYAEGGNCRVVFTGGALQIIGERCAGKRSLDQNHGGDRFGDILVPKEENEDGQGAGKVIVEVAEEAAAEPCIPGIDQAFTAYDPFIKLRKQGTVLMIKVHAQNGPSAEWD